MAIRRIVKAGHPALTRVADLIPDPTDPAVAALVVDMIDSLAESGGIGLAAPQIGESVRLVLYSVPASRCDREEDAQPMTVLVNPVLTPLDEDLAEGWEGCLSMPGLRGLVPRHTRLHLSWETLGGERHEREVAGYHARVVQHECDHLEGRLYPTRMNDLSKLVYVDELADDVLPRRPDQRA